MKKGTKAALWIAAGCIFIGGVLMGIGSAAGGQAQLREINDNSMGVSFDVAGINISGSDKLWEAQGTYKGEEETKGQEVLNGDFAKGFPAKDLRQLYVAVGVHALTVREGAQTEVTVTGENCDRIQCYVKNGKLVLKDVGKKKTNIDAEERKIVLTVPEGIVWQEADVDAAVASVSIDRLEAIEADLSAGMGKIEILQLSAGDLSIDADMGSVEINGRVDQKLEAEADMGSVRINLEQPMKDFNYNIETSMGSVILDGETYTGLDREMFINNMAQSSMDLDVAMGSIEISFK